MAAVCETLALLIPPSFVEFWRERGRDWGPIAAGALFGGGVWIWGDAVATSAARVPFDRVSEAGREMSRALVPGRLIQRKRERE